MGSRKPSGFRCERGTEPVKSGLKNGFSNPRMRQHSESLWKLSLIALAIALSGCANTGTVSRSQVNIMRNVETGSVIDVRPVVIEGTDSGIGQYSGGASGAVLAGSEVGSGTGSALAAIAGGTLGAIAGQEVEEMLTRQDGYEITIRLDSGRVVSIIQPAQVYVPSIGDAVLVTGGQVRLNPQYE